MTYRPDIDGLRSLAVVSVVLFHYELPGFDGGFVGVDIFFVISGFLISQIIFHECKEERFSLVAFYERRARRLLPALFATLTGTLIAGALVLFPSDLGALAHSAAATISFVANLYFWSGSGYFGGAAEYEPLLHMWSLAVEEQFYIVYPLFVLLLFRLGSGIALRLCFLMTLLFSFTLSVYAAWKYPNAAFYFPITRAWELMLGAVVARPRELLPALEGPRKAWVPELASAVGACLVLVPLAMLDGDSVFPGHNAIAPVLGTAMLIWSGGHGGGFLIKLMSNRLAVGLGLISYSLYLVHWPIWVFFGEVFPGGRDNFSVRLFLVACSLSAAWASWRFVELPFRDRKRFNRHQIFMSSGVIGLLMVLASIWLSLTPESAARNTLSAEQASILSSESYIKSVPFEEPECFLGRNRAQLEPCLAVLDSGGFMLWGDSYAEHLVSGLSASAALDFGEIAYGGCPPFLYSFGGGRPNCRHFSARATRAIEGLAPHRVVLVARWNLYDRDRWGIDLEAELGASIQWLRSAGVRSVDVIGLLPTWERSFPRLVIASSIESRPGDSIPLEQSQFDPRLEERLKRVTDMHGARYIPLRNLFCPEDRCATYSSNGEIRQWDSGHLTVGGSRDLGAVLAEALQLGSDDH